MKIWGCYGTFVALTFALQMSCLAGKEAAKAPDDIPPPVARQSSSQSLQSVDLMRDPHLARLRENGFSEVDSIALPFVRTKSETVSANTYFSQGQLVAVSIGTQLHVLVTASAPMLTPYSGGTLMSRLSQGHETFQNLLSFYLQGCLGVNNLQARSVSYLSGGVLQHYTFFVEAFSQRPYAVMTNFTYNRDHTFLGRIIFIDPLHRVYELIFNQLTVHLVAVNKGEADRIFALLSRPPARTGLLGLLARCFCLGGSLDAPDFTFSPRRSLIMQAPDLGSSDSHEGPAPLETIPEESSAPLGSLAMPTAILPTPPMTWEEILDRLGGNKPFEESR